MLNLSSYAHEYIDFAPQLPSDRAESIAQFTRKYGGNFEAIGTAQKFLMLLSILDYLGTGTPETYTMQDAVCFQDGDGFLSETESIAAPEPTIAEWLSHFAELAQVEESNALLWGFAQTLLENLHRGGGR